MTKTSACVMGLTLITLVARPAIGADAAGDKEHAELAKALSGAKVSLGAGLAASASQGKAISAKFEVEDGKLQLSVYTERDGKFSEVGVDPESGKVAKTEAITESDDLVAAKAQSAAMAKAKATLSEVITKAVGEHSGYRVVSVVPSVKSGRPVAEVELVKGDAWETVIEKLD